jgi:DNA processing protein
MDIEDRNRLAVAASMYGRPAVVAARARSEGVAAFAAIEEELAGERMADLDRESRALLNEGVNACLIGTETYPQQLAALPFAPPVLYFRGPQDLLEAPGIGMCGSRHASEEGIRAARACGEAASGKGLVVASGYARGVDMAAHLAALTTGGRTVVVLAEGIRRFQIKRGVFEDAWDPDRALIVSQFPPSQPWSAGNAMTRNGVIVGISRALVVVEAGSSGGTLAAGLLGLEVGRTVHALAFEGAPAGNAELLRKGAIPIRSRSELAVRLDDLPTGGSAQLTLL